MKTFTLSLLAAAAFGAITMGSANAMPFSANTAAAMLDESLVQNARVVCDRRGRCWNTGRRYSRYHSRRYYGRPGYYEPGYGYYRSGPRVGVGVRPFGFGFY